MPKLRSSQSYGIEENENRSNFDDQISIKVLLDRLNIDEYKCNSCNKFFKSINASKLHRQRHLQSEINKSLSSYKNNGDKQYTCEICNYSTRQNYYLQRHLNTHKNERLFKCEFCEYSSKQIYYLTIHTRIHTGEKPYSCNLCEYTCSAKSSLLTHMRTHTGEKPYVCGHPGCDYNAKTNSALKSHKRVRHLNSNKRKMKCPLCSKFLMDTSLKNHIRTHTREKPFSCQFCRREFAHCSGVKSHERICKLRPDGLQIKPYKCRHCNYGHNSKQLRNNHEHCCKKRPDYIPRQLKPTVCRFCQKRFSRCTRTKYHEKICKINPHGKSKKSKIINCQICQRRFANVKIRNMHENVCGKNSDLRKIDDVRVRLERLDLDEFKCNSCNKLFPSKRASNLHRKAHILQNVFVCSYSNCIFTCKNKAELQEHHVTHVWMKRPFRCNKCKQGFFAKQHLKNHNTRIHRDPKQTIQSKVFKCLMCSYISANRSHLKTHILTHTGERPFKCTECNYATRQRGHLRTHQLIHTKQKPFKCKFCAFACRTSGNLGVHIRRHTGEKPYACEYCNYVCTNSSSLDIHIRTHTRDKRFACSLPGCKYKSITRCSLKSHEKMHQSHL